MVLLMWRVSWIWFEHSNRLSLLLPLSQARTIRFLEKCVFYCGSAWHSSLRLFCQRNGREVSSTLVWRPPFAADSEWNSNCLPHRLQCSSCMLMYADVCSSQKNMFVTTQGSEKEGIVCQIEKRTCVFYIQILPSKNIRKIFIKKRHANRNNLLKQKGNKSDCLLMLQRRRFHIWVFYSILPEFQLGIGLRISLPENMFRFLPEAVPWGINQSAVVEHVTKRGSLFTCDEVLHVGRWTLMYTLNTLYVVCHANADFIISSRLVGLLEHIAHLFCPGDDLTQLSTMSPSNVTFTITTSICIRRFPLFRRTFFYAKIREMQKCAHLATREMHPTGKSCEQNKMKRQSNWSSVHALLATW